MLLRLEELEKRLDELELGETGDELRDELPGRAHSVRAEASLEENGAQESDAPYPDNPASRFGHRSLARSKLARNGLKAGTPAPGFRLPQLNGEELALEELRGKQVLLVFSDPHCGPCSALAPGLGKFHREQPQVKVVMISRGEPKENRAKVKEHGFTFPVVLQQRWEISRRYAMFATPIAYLIDESGVITHDVAQGLGPIHTLMAIASASVLSMSKT
jgi:peroxiredoxin